MKKRTLKEKAALSLASVAGGFALTGFALAGVSITESFKEEKTPTSQTQTLKKHEALLVGAYSAFGAASICLGIIGGAKAISWLRTEEELNEISAHTKKIDHDEEFLNRSIDKIVDEGRGK